jgi:hypothetical protein
VNVIASFHTATPAVAPVIVVAFTSVKPCVMFRTLQNVHAGFLNEIRLLRRQNHREVIIQIVETNAASIKIAMVKASGMAF